MRFVLIFIFLFVFISNEKKLYLPIGYQGYPELNGILYFGEKRYRQVVQFDSNYETSWIVGPDCKGNSCLMCYGDKQYICEKKCKKQNIFVNNYPSDGICGEGIVFFDGFLVKDQVQIQDKIVKNFNFFVSRKFQQRKSQLDADANISIGNSKKSFQFALKKNGIISRASFSFFMSHNSKFITFGGYERYLSKNNWAEFPIKVNQAAWTIGIQKVLINGKNTNLVKGKNNLFAFDTTLNGFALPPNILHKFRKKFSKYIQITTQSDFTFKAKCNDIAKMPIIEIELDKNSKTKLKLSPLYYVDWYNRDLHDNCVFFFYDSGIENLYLAGYLFFFENYVVFDQDRQKISVASLYEAPKFY